jgi:hypothetical protein
MFESILPPQSTNGRVDILNKPSGSMQNLFAMYDKIPAKQCATLRDPVKGIWQNTPLSNAYFSAANMRILQNGIRAGVYRQSNQQYTIGEQPCDVLKQIMRAMFLEHAVNNAEPICDQIGAINEFVIAWCVDELFKEAKGYLKYLQDASTLVVPLAPPTLVGAPDRRSYRMPVGL